MKEEERGELVELGLQGDFPNLHWDPKAQAPYVGAMGFLVPEKQHGPVWTIGGGGWTKGLCVFQA